VFRDPAAWYHLVLAVDTTQATAANRILFYVNGVQVTSFSASTNPTQSTTIGVNTASSHYLANRTYPSDLFLDGYMTEVNFIDGQQLTPSSFGTINSYGVWQPITYGGSYGTNGFYLPFTNNNLPAALGYDFSPQGNNWTPNNLSLARSYTTYTSSSGTYTVPTGVTSIQYLVVGGGGGGGITLDGGGGAGGMLVGTMTVTPSQTISYVVGAGGASASAGSNSTFGALIAYGGGTGTRGASSGNQNGGSGGGSYYYSSGGVPGTGVAGQGNSGGEGNTSESSGGGGGAGAIGVAASSSVGGAGGAGLTWINGTTYAGGGGGGAYFGTGGAGGSGGGGAGGASGTSSGSAGSVNTGGGGGGASYAAGSPLGIGGAGGSGIIIIATSSASTYDSMTDVPTLTSATAANYCVLNPLRYYYANGLSNGNLTITNPATTDHYANTGTVALSGSTSKFYAEMLVVTSCVSSTVAAGFGFANDATLSYATDTGNYIIYSNNNNGKIFSNGVSLAANITSIVAGANDIYQIAFDSSTGNAWVGKNNTWYNNTGGTTGDPATGANPTFTLTGQNFYPYADAFNNTVQANFGQRPFSYAAPSGFVALNTYNL
jgi:hypothetical protein